MKKAGIYVEHPIVTIDQPFSYLCEDDMHLKRGMRVVVPFHHQTVVGFVDTVEELNGEEERELKSVIEVLDEEPLLNEELYALGKWMAYHTISPTIACYQAMLPNKLSPKSHRKAVKMLEYVCYKEEGTFTKQQTKQQQALAYLKENGEMPRSEWRKMFGVSATKSLEEKGYAEIVEREARYQKKEKEKKPFLPLTKKQKEAFNAIKASEKDVILLHGATGSGKTEIYLQLAMEKMKEGKQVLILVPEISLTPQMVRRVEERFGDDVAIYHSRLNDQERYEQFVRVRNHEVSVVVGTRSAVFMPLDHIGLIVLDEEHDHSYKQVSRPFYHCRDIAIERGKYHHCKVLLGSATPSLESYARAHKGVYDLVTLSERVNNRPLPKCVVVDVNRQLRSRDRYILSKPLREAIQNRLEKNEQVILMLNRRGYQPVVRCADCNTVITCPDCDLAMNYHKDINKLVCHTCGRIMDQPRVCDKCGSTSFIRGGYGTQKLEEEVKQLFPTARVLRMDTDTVGKKNAHDYFFDQFGRHEADILLGTQMISKGLDYPLVTLVGILNSDALLQRSDFRSVETTFDLIVQASGRSGRGEDVGEVYIQAFDPNHYAIRYASRHDYLSFFAEEMRYRHIASYPPYTYLISIVFSHRDLSAYLEEILQMKQRIAGHENVRVLGPSDLIRTFNKERKRLIIKGKDLDLLISSVREEYYAFCQKHPEVSVSVDVNPMNLE